jgi:hypothetical protein
MPGTESAMPGLEGGHKAHSLYMKYLSKLFICISLFLLISESLTAQEKRTITGRVTDSQTGEAVAFANVQVLGSQIGTHSSFEGLYKLLVQEGDSLKVSFMGYRAMTKAIPKNGIETVIDFHLEPASTQLSEIVILPGENPAWPILRKVIENKGLNDRMAIPSYSYKSYTRTEMDIFKISERLKKNPITRKAARALDASKKIEGDSGSRVLPVFVSESVSDFYCNNTYGKTKEIIQKSKITGVGVADNSLLNQLVGQSFLNIDFYKNTISMLSKVFVSPLSDNWKVPYHYYLTDSIDLGGHLCYVIEFKPKNRQDLAFTGKMWIDKATSALVQIDASVTKDANINYIDKIKIQQEFAPTAAGPWLQINTRALVNINGLSDYTAGLVAKTYVHNSNIVLNNTQPLRFYEIPLETADNTIAADDYWQQSRPLALSQQELQVYSMVDSLKNIPSIKNWISTIDFLASGYKTFGKIELGPYLYTYSYNLFEGSRLRIGFRTNEKFSKNYILKGFVAGSTNDPSPFKFSLDASRILSRKHFTEIGIKGGFEAEQLGISSEELSFSSNLATALFSAFTRFGKFDRPFYVKDLGLYFDTEIKPGLTQKVSLTHRHFYMMFPFSYVQCSKTFDLKMLDSYRTSEFAYEIRYSRGEYATISKRNKRIKLRKNKEYPVYTFKYTHGRRMAFGDIRYHKLSASISKSFRFGLLGNSTITLFAGYTPSILPFPLLFIHQGNESPAYVSNAYNAMNYCEFISDRYASLHIFHDFEGLIFNRIPLVRELNWRFHITGKVLFGTLSARNDKLLKELAPFIPGADNNVYVMDPSIPYAEAGYGVDNIFKFLRVDFVHRLNYLSHDEIQNFSVKVSVSLKL